MRAVGAMQRLLDLVSDVPFREITSGERTRVWWARDAMAALHADAEMWAPLETGAALLGYREESQAVVTGVVFGGPRARHRRSSFTPDAGWQIPEIKRCFYASGRRYRYLGEIHTHPAGGLELSRRDRRTARRIARHRQARLPQPLMALLAGVSGGWFAATWEYREGALQACSNSLLSDVEIAELLSDPPVTVRALE